MKHWLIGFVKEWMSRHCHEHIDRSKSPLELTDAWKTEWKQCRMCGRWY